MIFDLIFYVDSFGSQWELRICCIFNSSSQVKLNNINVEILIIFLKLTKTMSIAQNIRTIWSPITRHTSRFSCKMFIYAVRKFTKRLSLSIWSSLIFIMTFLYYAVSKPVRCSLSSGKINCWNEQDCWENLRNDNSQIYEKKILQLLFKILSC